jgi:hypothetical protein
MGCSNFCTPRDLDELNYYTLDTTLEQQHLYQQMQKADAMLEVSREASTMQPPDATALQQLASTSPEAAVLAVAIVVNALFEAISTTIAAHRASEM